MTKITINGAAAAAAAAADSTIATIHDFFLFLFRVVAF